MKPIICVGHAALDHVYRIEAFPAKPTKVRSLEYIESGGGMAANAAATIARLGGPVELWGHVGADRTGEKVREFLQKEGVNVAFVRSFDGARTSTSAVIVDSKGERLIVGEKDHAMPMEADWLALSRIKDAGAVLSDLRWLEGTRSAFQEARTHGVSTMLDVDLGGGGGELDAYLGLADYAIFSAPAFEAFAPRIDQAGRFSRILAMGVRHAGVTRGSKGYSWVDATGASGHQPAFPVEVVDSTGAGDAFHGAFAWALARGHATPECARIAAGVAALKCRRLGARSGLPTFAELEAFLAGQT